MRKLFETTEINGMSLANRFVRSATWEGMAADDGAVTPQLIHLMTELARGGVGLIITSHSYVREDGQAGPWQLGIYKDDLVDGLKTLCDAIHDEDGRVVLQLAHAGFFASPKLTGQTPVAPSAVEGFANSPRKALSVDDIHAIVSAFAQAAGRAQAAGFDGVQIHAAHGYLLSQSLSPVFNHRSDNYGGDIQNRARFLIEVLQAIRVRVGKDFPVLVKLNAQDYFENGLSLEDSLEAGKMLAAEGINAIELSGGLLIGGKMSPSRAGIKSEEKEAYFQNDARPFKENIDVPLILVGGNRSLAVAERLIQDSVADYISMSRPLIREPGLINRWKSGDHAPAQCLSDNMCFGPAMEGKGIYCVTAEKGK